MIIEAPAITAASTAAMPTAPVPNTARLAPGGTASVLSTAPAPVWMPQPKGATRSSGMWLEMPTMFRSPRHRRRREARLAEEVAADVFPPRESALLSSADAGGEVVREEVVAVGRLGA